MIDRESEEHTRGKETKGNPEPKKRVFITPKKLQRTISPPPGDMIALGEEMVAWVEENEPYHLSEWYTIEKGFMHVQWNNFIQLKEFRPYYEIALRMIGRGYLSGKVHNSIAQRWMRIYFKDLKDDENEKNQDELDRLLLHKKMLMEFESQLSKNTGEEVSQEHLKAFSDLLSKFTKVQQERNVDDKSSSNA